MFLIVAFGVRAKEKPGLRIVSAKYIATLFNSFMNSEKS